MRHVGIIAGRELRSFFSTPVAYVVLVLWSVLAGAFFLSSFLGFDDDLRRAQQFGAADRLATMNLNDHLILPFIGAMWITLLFLSPAVTMGLFANEKANGTDELLLTSPVTIGEVVLGKFVASGTFMLLMTGIVGFYPVILFTIGDPEIGKTAAGLLGLFLVSLAYAAVGAFASSLTRNQLISFIVTLVMLLVLGLLLPFIVEVGLARGGGGQSAIVDLMRWMGTGAHFETMLSGVIDTADLAYFGVMIATFLLLARASIESVRWR